MPVKPVLAATGALALLGALVPAAPAAAASAGDLQGTVTSGGSPVASPVTVGWYEPGTGTERTVQTTSGGAYTLPLPAVGERFVVFADLAHAVGEEEPQLPHTLGTFVGTNGAAFEFQSRTRYTAGSTSPASLDLQLPAATPITGGDPALAHREVFLENRNGEEVGSTTADVAGAFRFEVVPGAFRLSVDRDAVHLAYRSPVFTVADGTPKTVAVAPRVGAVVTGVVRSGGKPVAGVRVRTGGAGVGSVRTKADGSYRLTGLTPGAHRIRFSLIGTPDEHSTYVPLSQDLTGLTAGSTTHLNAALTRGAGIFGSFAAGGDADHYGVLVTPAAGGHTTGWVGAAHATATSNPVYVSGLKPGSYLLRVYAIGGATYVRRVVSVTAGSTLHLGTIRPDHRTLTLSGTVGTGSGVVFAVNRNHFAGGFSVVSAGRYTVSGLIPGTYDVYSSSGTRNPALTTVKLAADTHRALSVGTRPGLVKGRVQVRGVDLLEGWIDADTDGDQMSFLSGQLDTDIQKGVLTGSGAAGTHAIYGVETPERPFQARSPYFLAWPADHLTLQAGVTTNIGTVQLLLQG